MCCAPGRFSASRLQALRSAGLCMGHKSNKLLADRVAALPRPHNAWPRWIVSGGGAGFLRPAPGSWGTAVPAAFFWGALLTDMSDATRAGLFLGMGLIASGLLIA